LKQDQRKHRKLYDALRKVEGKRKATKEALLKNKGEAHSHTKISSSQKASTGRRGRRLATRKPNKPRII
jgi:hypothetical protein